MLGPLQRLAAFTAGAAAGGAAGALAGLAAAGIARHRRDRTGLSAGLLRALSHNGFEMRYQPIVRLPGRQCIGAEALLRMRNHAGTLIGPGAFIPLAEHSGLIQAITERVIELVGKDISAILAARPDLHVSINLPPAVLAAGWLQQVARRSRLYPLLTQLIIEITETGTVGARGREIVGLARALGVRVAIDDFGTGANDLAQLQDLQVDFIKIDHSFVAKVGSQAPGARLIEAIVTIARDVNAGTIAEGVETEAQAAYLHEIGVDFGQGFLFAPPLTLRELRRYLGGGITPAPPAAAS
jgi:sensor c-di-GMP phosphodiesterase-like protein